MDKKKQKKDLPNGEWPAAASTPDENLDPVDLAGVESFPASDPPSYNAGKKPSKKPKVTPATDGQPALPFRR